MSAREALDLHEGDEVPFRVERSRALLAKTPDLMSLTGSVQVPAGKRGTAWDDVLRQTRRSRAALASDERWLLADLVLAECVYVLESFYEVGREQVAELMRATLAHPTIGTVDPSVLVRALEVYELDRLDFADAYLVAQAESTGIGEILSFDREIDRVASSWRDFVSFTSGHATRM